MPSEFAPPGGKPRVTKKQIQEMQENYKKAESLAKDTASIEAAEKANLDDVFAKEFEEVFTVEQQIGVYVGRFQPFHIGHENIVKQMLEQNDKVLIFIGTGGDEDINPFSYQQCESFFSEYTSGDCIIQEIPDAPEDIEWSQNLAKMIDDHTIANSHIHFYAGDLEEDYAIRAAKLYIGDFLSVDIDYKEISREDFLIDIGGKEITLSATICRMAIEHNDWDFLKKTLPENVYNILKSTIT